MRTTDSSALGVDEPAGAPSSDPAPAKPIRVVVVDDHELLRAGTRQILEEAAGFAVVGEAGDGDTALRVVAELRPDVALVDIRLPDVNGIELARRIVTDHPGTTVLVLSAYDDEDYVRAALAAGVSGYLLKTTPSHELVGAIRAAHGGSRVLDRSVSARLLEGPAPTSRNTPGPAQLTVREREVVQLVARGLANKAIGRELGISPRTVEGHLNHVFEKLGTASRTELVHFALVNGLLSPDRAGGDGPAR